MAQPAFFHETLEARLVTGKVLRVEGKTYSVLADGVRHEAFLAASCLLEPCEKDTVLLAFLEDATAVVLSVLVRNDAATACVRLPDNSDIECPGNLTVRGGTSLDLCSGEEMRLASHNLHVASENATASLMTLNTVTDTAQMCCRALTNLGQTAVFAFRSLTQCLGESKRMVEGNDETHCASATLMADENATVMSKNALNLAEETSRTDAKLIQLG